MDENIIISTERLILREFDLEDAEAFYLLNSDPEVMRYTGDIPFSSHEDARKLIHNYDNYKKDGFGRWTVIRRADSKIIGWCGLKKHTEGFVDLGYRFFRNIWGNGYATEAASSCIDYGFATLNLNEIIGRTARDNSASVRVLEKIGMSFWKEEACEGIKDSLIYRIIAENYWKE